MEFIAYRKLHRYKYALLEDYQCETGIPGLKTTTSFLKFREDGRLIVLKGYSWDGPSGPTRDTPNFMRGSLVHDALYQLMRMGSIAQEHRDAADKLLHEHCREDGMTRRRARMVYEGLERFGARAARVTSEPEIKFIYAPKKPKDDGAV